MCWLMKHVMAVPDIIIKNNPAKCGVDWWAVNDLMPEIKQTTNVLKQRRWCVLEENVVRQYKKQIP